MIIGERARQAIAERATAEGKDAIAYAEEIGISKASFKNWLKQCEPRAYPLSLMAEAGLDVHWILTGQEDGKVDVVRCEQCLYRSQYPDESGHYKCGGLLTEDEEPLLMVKPDFYCAYGERRADNGR